MFIQIVMAAMLALLFACQVSENAAEVKSNKAERQESKDKDAYQECIKAITQNQDKTLREKPNDPNCELTESNNISRCQNILNAHGKRASLEYSWKGTEEQPVKIARLDVEDEAGSVYQRYFFSDPKACKCMQDKGMTLGVGRSLDQQTGELYWDSKVVRVGLGDYTEAASSDRYSIGKVNAVYVQLLPDDEGINTNHYCRLKITGYTHKVLKKYMGQFVDDDGELKPQDDGVLVDGFTVFDSSKEGKRFSPIN